MKLHRDPVLLSISTPMLFDLNSVIAPAVLENSNGISHCLKKVSSTEVVPYAYTGPARTVNVGLFNVYVLSVRVLNLPLF